MLGIVGTIPKEDFPIIHGKAYIEGDQIIIKDVRIPINRGTPAMIAAAVETLNYMGQEKPYCYLVGDIGDGHGCEGLYKHLIEKITDIPFTTLALHYFQPNVDLFKKLLAKIKAMLSPPILIADAGFMYVAKMGGDSSSFDLFTPDAGELAYLADEKAPHPFYTRGFILHEENRIPDLIKRAYQYNNAASYLLVKGANDYIANEDGILAQVNHPMVEALEAIGGTGDTLTGIVSAMIASGMDIQSSGVKAAKVNRLAGFLSKPNPATQIYDIIREITPGLDRTLKNKESNKGL